MNAVDPWTITPRERIKYEEQFKSLQPINGIVTGVQAKGFLLQSQLSPLVLGQIWALADTDADGKMNLNEFSIACKLINLKLRQFEIPKVLPPTLLASLQNVGGTPTRTPTSGLSPLDPMKQLPPMPPQPNLTHGVMPPQAIIPPTMNNMGAMSAAQQQPLLVNQMQHQPMIGVPPLIPPQPSIIPPARPPIVPMQPLMSNLTGGVGVGVPGMAGIGAAGVPPMIPPQPQMAMMGSGLVQPLIDPMSMNQQSLLLDGPVMPAAPVSVPAPPTPPHNGTQSRSMSISERAPSIESPGSASGQSDWAVKGPAKLKYTQLFNTTDRSRSGFLTGTQARHILVQSKLPQAILAQIWGLADMDSDGRLGCEEFVLAMYLCDLAIQGEKIPTVLPPDLIPPSFRKTTSRHGSIVGGSRHGSVSSQGAAPSHNIIDADPSAGLPQNSFEDKRKENYEKGQAELERRRKQLLDIQRKEQEERERKEREEFEKREKARLEAELKKQQELERELQRQRELEQEREEARKRDLEKRETARKEMEKQRQLEWEAQKIQEMQTHRQREQEKVLKLKAQNQTLNIELSTLTEKIKELSQKICDTRVGVTNVKTVIDGMRSTRDTQMSEMAQLKAQVKEQNQRLIILSQEKAKLDSKTKANQAADAASLEQTQAAFSNKQIIINQLKDKLENSKKEVESKKLDINANNEQLSEVKTDLSDLIMACEELYSSYDVQRIQVLELKNNRKNDSYTSGWGAAESNSWEIDTTTTNTAAISSDAVVADIETPPGYVKYRALYEFFARNADEITFQPGDTVLVPIEQNAEPGWLAGEINGHTGWFPETYVEKIDSGLTSAVAEPNSYDNTQTLGGIAEEEYAEPKIEAAVEPVAVAEPEPDLAPTSAYNGDVETYYACYAYQSSEVGDLTFDAGEIVMVTKKEGDWWTGIINGTRTGIFPSNYVQKQDVYNDQIKADAGNNIAAYQQEQETIQTAEDARNQAEADSEVSQINTQPINTTNESSVQEYRCTSTTSSATPSLRNKKGEVAQVVAPYEATSAEQLSLTRGQLVMIRKKTDSGWWEGELQAKGRRRQIGWFPATYVKVLQGGRNSGRNTPVSASKIDLTETILDKVISLYPYKALNDDELSFEKDDIISVLGRDEPEWWRGELNGVTGLFPSNYVGPFVSSGNV